MALKIGDKAPEILGVDQDGKEIKLSEYKGEKVILYFYPKDNTPGCSAEACSLRDGYDELRQKGYEVIGVSKDSQKSHKNFIEKKSLPFNLISDADIKLQEEFGADFQYFCPLSVCFQLIFNIFYLTAVLTGK